MRWQIFVIGLAILYGVVWAISTGNHWEAVAFILTIIVAIAIHRLSK